jgi:hypothetical protein
MNFKELKTWAADKGYDVMKESKCGKCVWTKIDDPSVSGVADSLQLTAQSIFNHFTHYKWVEYQKEQADNKIHHHSAGSLYNFYE